MKKISEQIVSTMGLADILGVTDRTIQKYVTEGVLEKLGRGRFVLGPAVKAYVNYQVDLIRDQKSTGTKEDEETRWTKERADMQAMKNEMMRGELIPISVVIQVMSQIIIPAKTRLSQIKGKVKTVYPELSMEIIDEIGNQVNEALEDLSKDDLPERYRKAAIASSETMDAAETA
jgi:phage terminase Nu1 subunit (DNA packaging protein)